MESVEEFGPLAFIVTFGGFLIAAGAALRALWAGKFFWDPDLGAMERAAVKVVGLGTAIGLSVSFASFYNDLKNPALKQWTVGIAVLAFAFFLIDVTLRHMLFVRCDPNNPNDKRVVRGFSVTKRTRDLLAGTSKARSRGDLADFDNPPPSARVFYCSLPAHMRDPDIVWTHKSQTAAIVSIIAVYVIWSGLATNGLALAAMLASGAAAK